MPSLPHFRRSTSLFQRYHLILTNTKLANNADTWKQSLVKFLFWSSLGSISVTIPYLVACIFSYRFYHLYVEFGGIFTWMITKGLISFLFSTMTITICIPFHLLHLNMCHITLSCILSTLIMIGHAYFWVYLAIKNGFEDYNNIYHICYSYFYCQNWDIWNLITVIFATLCTVSTAIGLLYIWFWINNCCSCCSGGRGCCCGCVHNTASTKRAKQIKHKQMDQEKLQSLINVSDLNCNHHDDDSSQSESKPKFKEIDSNIEMTNGNYNYNYSNETTTTTTTIRTSITNRDGIDNDVLKEVNGFVKITLLYVVVECLFLLSLNTIFSNIFIHKSREIYFEMNYYGLLIYCFIFRVTLKYIARIIDTKRAVMNYQNQHHNKTQAQKQEHHKFDNISLELLTQLMITSYYYIIYRYIVLFHAPSLVIFIITKLTHIATEVIQSLFLMSQFYFDQTTLLIKCLQLQQLQQLEKNNYNNSSTLNYAIATSNHSSDIDDDSYAYTLKDYNYKFSLPIRVITKCILLICPCNCFDANWFADDVSTLQQFRTRVSIDVILNLTGAIISAIWIILGIVCVGPKYFNNDEKEFNTGLIYNGISIVVEIVYFITAVVVIKKYYHFDFFLPFYKHINSTQLKKHNVWIISCSIFVSIVFHFL